jgi:CDP-glucose 4,6-dehydratase
LACVTEGNGTLLEGKVRGGNEMPFCDVYKGKTAVVTGHTGFKGSWLSEWLLQLGCKVIGYSLGPPTDPSHYSLTNLSTRLFKDIRGDVRNHDKLCSVLSEYHPDFVFHLAAQSIVRLSFERPRETIETNILGTYNVLEAIRYMGKDCVSILITTDKVYENKEWVHSYREVDTLGGYEPYSASKACAEIIISSFFRTFFRSDLLAKKTPVVAVASVRAGNVIGGGDWAEYRIVPDCVRSLERNRKVPVRNKTSTRPWQHVLEALSGYLVLASEIYKALYSNNTIDVERLELLCSPFNFGPNLSSNKTVMDLVNEIFKYWPGEIEDKSDPNAPHEARKLNLTIDKAFHSLGWRPQWDFEKTVRKTVEWYKSVLERKNDAEYVQGLTRDQIIEYASLMPY